MIATREPGPALPPTGGRPIEPMRPDLRYRARADSCAVSLAVNGTEYRAVLDLDAGGFAKPRDVAAMLRAMADQVEVG